MQILLRTFLAVVRGKRGVMQVLSLQALRARRIGRNSALRVGQLILRPLQMLMAAPPCCFLAALTAMLLRHPGRAVSTRLTASPSGF